MGVRGASAATARSSASVRTPLEKLADFVKWLYVHAGILDDGINTWTYLNIFNGPADDEQAALVMDAAEELVKTLHNSEDPKRCPTLRVRIVSSTAAGPIEDKPVVAWTGWLSAALKHPALPPTDVNSWASYIPDV